MLPRSSLPLLCLLACLPAAHAAKRAFTIEDNYRLRGVESLSVAPDGSVVFAVKSSDLPKAQQETHLWMTDGRGGEPRQLTFSEKGESSPAFSRDGKWIVFVSSRDGDQNLYILPVGGGEARKLTNISTGAGDPLVVARRQVDRVFERRLPRVRRRRRLQQEDRRALDQGKAAGTHGRQPALPPLDRMEGRQAHAHSAGRSGHGQGPRSDAGQFRRAAVSARRRAAVRLLARRHGAGLRVQSRSEAGVFHQQRSLDCAALRQGGAAQHHRLQPRLRRQSQVLARRPLHRLPDAEAGRATRAIFSAWRFTIARPALRAC